MKEHPTDDQIEVLEHDQNLQVARIILGQLGGQRFIAMTGASDFVGAKDYLMFWLPNRFAKNGINKVKITLHWTDTYIVEAMRLGPVACEIVETAETVFVEDLRRVFTNMTGLDTSL